MSLLIETIRIINGGVENLEYHNARMNESRKELFDSRELLDLSHYVQCPGYFGQSLTMCRVLYDKFIREIDYVNYELRSIKTIQLVTDNDVVYNHKYADRSSLDKLWHFRKAADEVLIVKEGRITDCINYNVALKSRSKWYTPAFPLLKGTARQRLMDEGQLEEEKIMIENLGDYSEIALINAMTDLGEIVVDVDSIVF